LTKKKQDTSLNKEKRLQALEKILAKFEVEEKKASPKELLAALKKEKFNITRFTLYAQIHVIC